MQEAPDAPFRRLDHELVAVLAQAATVREAAPRLLERLAAFQGWAVGLLWLLDGDGALLRPVGGWNAPVPALAEFRRVSERLTFARGVGGPGRAWAEQRSVWIEDVAQEPGFPRHRPAADAGIHATVAAPLIGPGGVLGVVELFAREPRPADAVQIEALALAGRQIAQYVARLDVEDRLRHSEELSQELSRAALDCIITMDHEGTVVDFNPAAEATFGWSREEAVGRLLADLIVPAELRDAHRAALSRYVATREPRILGQRLELTGRRADDTTFPVELTVTRLGRRDPPLFAGFIRDISDRRRTEQERTMLLERERAARLRAERAERDARRIAQTLQRSLLPPRLPDIPGLQLGCAYRPATEGSEVGGDFYDVVELGADCWGITIGDVRGKGVGAAAVTALVRYTLRAAAVHEKSPAAALQVVNDALRRDRSELELCTAVYARLDASSPVTMRVAVAGHPLPLVLSASGTVRAAGRIGTLLGAVPDPALEEADVTLEPGDAIVFYTDGVPDARTEGGRYGDERLIALLGQCAGCGAQAIAERIDASVAAAAVARPADDVAVLVVRAGG